MVSTGQPLAAPAGVSRHLLSSLRDWVWLGLVFLLPVLLLLPGLVDFPYPSSQALYSDLTISHYPNAYYLRQALQSGDLPLWSPTILSGYPFAANPLSGMWYPPGWLALVFPLPLAFNLLVMLHLLWGGAGLYLLLRLEGLQPAAAGLAGLAFAAMPKLYAHYGAGHVSLIFAVCWTPWLLFTARRWLQPGQASQSARASSWVLPAMIFAAIILADVRWAAYAGILWWSYALFSSWTAFRQVERQHTQPSGWDWKSFLLQLIGQASLAALVAAPLLVPLVEYTRLSTRSLMSSSENLAYSLPPARLLGLIFPDYAGFHEWMLYPGWLILVLALLAVAWRSVNRRVVFWAFLAVLSLVFSLGQYLPWMPSLARLPLIDLLRVPPRALFLSGMGLTVLAGYGLNALLNDLSYRQRRIGRLLLVGLVGFIMIVAAVVFGLTGTLPLGYAWGVIAGLLSLGWIWLRINSRLSHRSLWLVGLYALCFLDLGALDRSLFAPRPAESVLSEAAELTAYLKEQPGVFRVYSPSYNLPQQSAIRSGLELADGVDPLQLEAYASFMEDATGVPLSGYSVTLPPFLDGNAASANSGYTPRPDLLGLLNVRFIAAQFDLAHPNLVQRAQFGKTRLYENLDFRPRAWVQPETAQISETYTSVESIDWAPDRIEIQANGPGLMVLSEISYPGWRVWVDGEQKTLLTSATIMRSVNLEPGLHRIVFSFQPLSVYAGLSLFALGMGIVVTLSLLAARRRAE